MVKNAFSVHPETQTGVNRLHNINTVMKTAFNIFPETQTGLHELHRSGFWIFPDTQTGVQEPGFTHFVMEPKNEVLGLGTRAIDIDSFQQLILGSSNYTSPCTRPRTFPLVFLETNSCPTLYLPLFPETINILRPLPDFILQLWRKLIFLHSCKIKSGSGLRMRLSY